MKKDTDNNAIINQQKKGEGGQMKPPYLKGT